MPDISLIRKQFNYWIMQFHTFKTAITLYRSHLKSYLLLSLRANTWLLLLLSLIIPVVMIVRSNFSLGQNLSLVWLMTAIVIVFLFLYGLGKYWVNAGVISRLAFRELANQPETVREAQVQVAPHLWGFVLANIILVLIFTVTYILCLVVVSAFAIAISGSSASGFAYFVWFFIIIKSLETSLKFFGLISTWLGMRLFIFEIPLAIESNCNFFSTITRSWGLTKRNLREVFSAVFLIGLITFPLEFMVFKALEYSFSKNFVVFICLLFSLPWLVKVITLPLWQAAKGAIYYNLRNDNEFQVTLDYPTFEDKTFR